MDVSLDQDDMTVATKQRTRTPSILNNAEGDGMVGLRSFDGHQDDQAELGSSEAMKKSSTNTIRYDLCTEKLQHRDERIAKRKRVEAFSVIRRVVKSEAMNGTHVRTKEIGKSSFEYVEFVHRKVDKIIKRIEKVKLMERRGEWSQQRQIDHVSTDTDELIHAHPPRTAARWWQEFVRNEVFMKAEWNAEAAKPNAYHKVENLNDDVTSRYVHGDEFTVELRTDGFQDAKVMLEQDVDINASTIIGTRQNQKTKVVKPVSSWRPAGTHVGQIGAVESSTARDKHRCNDKENEKHNG